MAFNFFTRSRQIGIVATASLIASIAAAEPQHGIAMYGDPALPPDFAHLPYANPNAPTGGAMITSTVGSFDSLNPFITKGTVFWQLRFLMGESLMARSLDEPFSLYGLLAESIETAEDRSWVEFTLRPEARFSDGSPVTVEDVIWSYETLGTIGHPRYRGFYEKVDSIEQTGDRSVRLTFNVEDRELALLAGLRPILQKSQWDGLDFENSELGEIPIVSSPYSITSFEPNRFIEFSRNEDYWGADVVPFVNGLHNLDTIRIEFFGDEVAAFEAFKVGEVNSNREFNIVRWDTQYDTPLIQSGDFIKSVLPHSRPSGMRGFVMNTRNPQFEDIRVRDALTHAFNFEFINETITGGASPRITSVFSNSPLAMQDGPATGRVLEFLEPFADSIPAEAISGYALPVSDGSERNRANIGAALGLMEQAGYTIQDGVMAGEDGTPFSFDILLETNSTENTAIIDIYTESLSRLGEGGRNMMGVQSEAIDTMIGRLLTSDSQDDFVAATRAMDRLLTSGRYVIPIYQWNISRIAHDKNLHFPDTMPIFGDWPGWQPDAWWYEED